MSGFTLRALVEGTFAVVTSTHYLGSMAAWRMIERGGNAVDAAAACGFALQVAEPHLNGPAGECPMLIYIAKERRVYAINGQGAAPRAATIDRVRGLGITLIPGDGLLPATVPAAFDAWITALLRFGTMSLEDVLTPAAEYAETGIVLQPYVRQMIETAKKTFLAEWPSSAAVYLPGGEVPAADKLFRNPDLAATFRRLIEIERAHRAKGRAAALMAARDAWYKGFVAETIDKFCRSTDSLDASGRRNPALLRGDDLAAFETHVEAPVAADYHGLVVHKCGPWSQGPVFLQHLRLLENFDLAGMGLNSADYLHTVIETQKLAFADREVYYGDPAFVATPLDRLLARDYAQARAALVDAAHASREFRFGVIEGVAPNLAFLDLVEPNEGEAYGGKRGTPPVRPRSIGVGDPMPTPLGLVSGDTVHMDVIDKDGNMVAATGSGGWLQSSPVVPGLGFPLATRGQMFWLVEGHPNALAPGKRPRTTLTPTIVTREGEPYLAFGSPGGDYQDQWTLHFFLNHVHFGLDIQEAIEQPEWQSIHVPDSFYPRGYTPAGVMMEDRMAPEVVKELVKRGHRITPTKAWFDGRHVAAQIDTRTGIRRAASNPRRRSSFAVGR